MRRELLALAIVASLPAAACSSSSSHGTAADASTDVGVIDAGPDCEPSYDESDADLTTPTVSFANDVLPIWQPSCGIAGSTCHGATNAAPLQPYLGAFDGGTDASQVLSGIVGVPSYEDPSMNLVTAGDPSNSYLVQKLDNQQCTPALTADCAKGQSNYPNCGVSMPFGNPPLPSDQYDTIRRWIAQGAKNN
jgi:hypothetical protein